MRPLLEKSAFGVLEKGDLVYFDAAATSLVPKRVTRAVARYYDEVGGSPGRGVHRAAARAWRIVETCRETVASFLNCDVAEVVFVKNATDGINLVAQGLSWATGDVVAVTIYEHHSNLLPWLRAGERFGVAVTTLIPGADGDLLPSLRKALRGGVKLVACTQTSNVLGSSLPVKEIASLAHAHGALVLVDGAQAVPHGLGDVASCDADFYAFSGHKALGPLGAGALVVRRRVWDLLRPSRVGGGVVNDLRDDEYVLTPPPTRYEAGTYDVGSIAGLTEALTILQEIGREDLAAHARWWAAEIRAVLKEIRGVEIYGADGADGAACSFNLRGITPHRAAMLYDQWGNVAVRSGHHCALPLVRRLLGAAQGTIRVSPYVYNDTRDLDVFVATTRRILAEARREG